MSEHRMITDAVYDLIVGLLGTVFYANTTQDSTLVDGMPDTINIDIGDVIVGPGIEAGATVAAKDDASITMSAVCTSTNVLERYAAHKNNIFLGFQNNFPEPTDNDFITITELGTVDNGRPVQSYDTVTEVETYTIASMTSIQLDFYGVDANNNARYVRTALRTPNATVFLSQYSATVYQVKDIQNMSESLDYENYVNRFTFVFSLFNNNQVMYSDLGTSELPTNELIYAGVPTS